MKPRMKTGAVATLGAALALSMTPAHAGAAPPAPSEFAWRAPLQVPPGTSVARVALPAQALLQLQSPEARDARIHNAAGEAVAFARTAAVSAPVARTRIYPALPLYNPPSENTRPKGAVRVRIDGPGGQRSVWVQMDGAEAAGLPRLNAVLFSTKDEQRLLSALEIQGTLPANTPVAVAVSSSADLAQWTAARVRGRLYRFDGDGAPVNMTLEFEQPVKLEGRFLRLDWNGQEGVSISAVSGIVAPAARAPQRVRAELPALRAASGGALELATGFATPLAGLMLSTPRENSLLPLRMLGRNEPSQPWRLLGRTVVYRLGPPGNEAINPPQALHGVSARWLRLESTGGADLAGSGLKAVAEFDPVELLFVATGAGPFELAVGRPDTPVAALPLSTISTALGARKVEDLPAAAVGPAVLRATADAGVLARYWPGDAPPGKAAVLWVVLLAGVLLLAGVAGSLLRQLRPSGSPPA
jgi:hypothetical protein